MKFMVNPIGGISAMGAQTAGGQAASGGAPAQLAKLQSDLSDWVYCESCNTPEGKAKIADITAKIENLQATMKAAEDRKAALRANEIASSNAQASSPAISPSSTGNGGSTTALGQNVDEYA